jgi:outer membrane protein assembly factor BamB/predicted phosphodiesterase
MRKLILILLLSVCYLANAQTSPFRFAFISDTHIGSPNGAAEEDLKRTVDDINSMSNIDFVVLTGDITELGTDEQLQLAKSILAGLKLPYYIIPGNHDTGWSESGGLSFTEVFGYDKFYFKHKGIHFIGCASGPYVRMSDGHVPRDAMNWMQETLKKVKKNEPVIFLNHYPLDNGLDNWYQVIDLLKSKNTLIALCGHGHSNRPVKAEEIPSVMGRSNLRAKANEGGYNLVDIRQDSILFTERKPLSRSERKWTGVAVSEHHYDLTKPFTRPDFTINNKYSKVKTRWTYHSSANVISTPVVTNGLAIYGNQNGVIEALDLKTGKRKWKTEIKAPVFSSPAAAFGKIVFGAADGTIYCLDKKGKIVWKKKTNKAVLGSPLIENNTVYIGGSDHHFYAYNLTTGIQQWSNNSLAGPVVSKPVIYGNYLVFGAWDTNLYCLDKTTGATIWKWNNGSSIINFSPAACIPVIKDSVVYIVAPDRFLSAIHLTTGKTLWRTNEATIRESIGMSEDGNLVYGKTMQDTVVAFYTNKEQPKMAWKLNVGYGYEHAPSMLIQKGGKVFFGTRNGVVYSIDPSLPSVVWAHKIDNSMVNTLNVLSPREILATTMDGKIELLEVVD